jgi:hypothetical protein
MPRLRITAKIKKPFLPVSPERTSPLRDSRPENSKAPVTGRILDENPGAASTSPDGSISAMDDYFKFSATNAQLTRCQNLST